MSMFIVVENLMPLKSIFSCFKRKKIELLFREQEVYTLTGMQMARLTAGHWTRLTHPFIGRLFIGDSMSPHGSNRMTIRDKRPAEESPSNSSANGEVRSQFRD